MPEGFPKLDPEAYYDELGRKEWDRLDRDPYHRFEFEGTVEYLERHLPDSGRVLDVGGGAGRYAVWLAERGYDVTLVDVSAKQREVACEKVTERNLRDRVTVEAGDVRDLGFEADAFDATLCLGGPLSHVTDDAERETAARELRRVTRPGRPVFVSVMGRLAVLLVVLQHAGELPEEQDETELLPEFAAHGTYDRELLDEYDREPTSFAVHLFRVAELEELLESAGLAVERVVGLENVASVRRGEVGDLSEGKRAAVSETVRMLREDRSAADLSSHVLAVTRVR